MEPDGLTVLCGGVQSRLDLLPERPTPPSFEGLPNGVQRDRARDAWLAAGNLCALVDLWMKFLMLGTFRARLSPETEAEVRGRFPDLAPMASVLEGLARTLAWPEGLAASLEGVDEEHGLIRQSAPGHTVGEEPRPFRLMDF